MSRIKLKFIGLLILPILAYFIFSIINWMDNNPKHYLDDITLSFKGKVVNKFFLKVTHLEVDLDNCVIDISMLSEELREQATIGDSLIKFPNSNCCKLIKDSNEFILRYINIPDAILKRSKYLTKINNQKCD